MDEKMIVRSITYTINFNKLDDKSYLQYVESNLLNIKNKFIKNKIKIRTMRFNIIAIDEFEKDELFTKIDKLSEFSKQLGLRWFNLSFNLINKLNTEINVISDIAYKILKLYDNAFINFIVAENFINNYAVIKSSELIKKISYLNSNGIDNFRFGVSLNVKANTSFFPFSYSNKNDSFSLAIETTQKVVSIIKKTFENDYIQLKKNIIEGIKDDLLLFENISNSIVIDLDIDYNGQDISLSPYPDENVSVIEILNLLGVKYFGSNGTQFMTSYLTSILKDTINQYSLKSIGFNGVMYSMLEDKLMCQANDDKNFSIDSIILYSTVCGCGLDMVPLPDITSKEEIASMILDVATIAIKLDKPLGVRVLPIPDKNISDTTNLKLDFLTNTNIPEIKNISINKSLFKINKFYIK